MGYTKLMKFVFWKCVCYLQISHNCWWQVFLDLRRSLLGYLLRTKVMKRRN